MEIAAERGEIWAERTSGRQNRKKDWNLAFLGFGAVLFLLTVSYGMIRQTEQLIPLDMGRTGGKQTQLETDCLTVIGTAVPDGKSIVEKAAVDRSVFFAALGSAEDEGKGVPGTGRANMEPEGRTEGQTINRGSSLVESTAEEKEDSPPVPAEIALILYGNGGLPERADYMFEPGTFNLEEVEGPKRLGKIFDGWYLDPECTMPFSGRMEEGTAIELYAGWKEFPGYICDEMGYVIGCSDIGFVLTDGLVALPTHESCVGLRAGAYAGVEEEIFEVYVPANITEIEKGAFSSMPNLLFIQVAEGNPAYYSEDGILYRKDGSLEAIPPGR